MIYSQFKDKQLSLLGLGAMRLPTNPDGTIDEQRTDEMVAYCIAQGVNYFDTAYFYHNKESEQVIGKVLARHPRESWYLATKYPGSLARHPGCAPKEMFEGQLRKCGVEYFDFYLLHNVDENTMANFLDPELGIIDYLVEQKRLGRIHHLGFSCHAETENLKKFLDLHGDKMEFCQIQLNWLDWTLQDAKGKYELLTERNIPVWVMEPVRGGRLASLPDADEAALKAIRPDASIPSWSFRFLQGLDNVHMILSGMSNMEQLQDNLNTFCTRNPLSEQESALLQAIAEKLKTAIPCTGCQYCCDGCPQSLDIPGILALCNKLRFAGSIAEELRSEFLPENRDPAACIACGKCNGVCPQHIDIPTAMKDFAKKLPTLSGWAEICSQRMG